MKPTNNLKELTAKSAAALNLLDSETADKIIGEPGEEYQVLIQGAESVVAMTWAVYKSLGLRQTTASLKAAAQSMAMILTLVHYAYALGIERGRKENEK